MTDHTESKMTEHISAVSDSPASVDGATGAPAGRSAVSRRTVLRAAAGAGAVTGALALAGCSTGSTATPSHPVSLTPAQQATATIGEIRLMNLCAHPDDDLYFMTPDTRQAIAAGASLWCVYLAAGEADGRNSDVYAPHHEQTPVDFPGYAEARQNGLRAAYAQVATGDRHSPWKREVVAVIPGVMVERDTLIAAPQIKVHFVSTRIMPGARLRNLWDGSAVTEPTLVATDSPQATPQVLSREDVVALLTALLNAYRPTLVHTMDPDPEHAFVNGQAVVSTDHQDHTATAAFVLAALARHRAKTGRQPVVDHFRAYANKLWPGNLSAKDYADKLAVLNVYGGNVPDCPGGLCGDKQVSGGAVLRRYGRSTWLRYQPRATWLRLGGDGRLTAFHVAGGLLHVTRERAAGSDSWHQQVLPQIGLMPSVQVLVDAAGCFHVLALQRSEATHGHVRVSVLHLAQTTAGGNFDLVEEVGNPQYVLGRQDRFREIGVPAAAFDSTGGLHVFVRNFDHAVSHISKPAGGVWSGWENLAGLAPIQDALTAHTRADGIVELYAPGRTDLWCYTQTAPGAGFSPARALNAGAPASPVTVTEDPSGVRTVHFREQGTAQIVEFTLPAAAAKTGQPQHKVIASHGGTGAVAVWPGTQQGGLVLAHRNQHGGVSWRDTSGADWADLEGMTTQVPAAAADSAGRLVLVALGMDGHLRVTRQTGGATVQTFAPWRAL